MLTGGGGRNLGSQKLVRKWFLPALACDFFGRNEFPPPSFISLISSQTRHIYLSRPFTTTIFTFQAPFTTTLKSESPNQFKSN